MALLLPERALLFLMLMLFLVGAVIITFVISVWRRTDIDQTSKIMWTIFFIAAPVISIICYLIFGYKKQNLK